MLLESTSSDRGRKRASGPVGARSTLVCVRSGRAGVLVDRRDLGFFELSAVAGAFVQEHMIGLEGAESPLSSPISRSFV